MSVSAPSLFFLLSRPSPEAWSKRNCRKQRWLGNQGKFVEEIRLLDSLVHSAPAVLDDADRGMAWNTLAGHTDT